MPHRSGAERTVVRRGLRFALRSRRAATCGRRHTPTSALLSCRSGLTRTTFQTIPSFSSAPIARPLGSARRSSGRSPWNADVGKAWWLWCHDSPSDGSASQKTLRDSSSVSKRRRPKKWQTELIDHVMWCSRKIRTKPPHTSPSRPPTSEKPLSTNPSAKGTSSVAPTQKRNVRLTQRRGAAVVVVAEHPADMRVPEALQRALEAVLEVDVRAVRVALLVGEGVVLAVVGDPCDDAALDGHRAEYRE